MQTTDAHLLQNWVQARDPEALSAIVTRHSAMVYGTCRRILGNAADAEDATQECFMRLTQVDRAGTSLVGLLHTIATRQALNRIRSESRRRARERAFAELNLSAVEPSWDDVRPLIDEAIDALPDRQRIPLIRHFLEGETHAAIASDLGLSREGVTRRIQAAIEAVRKQLRARGVPVAAAGLGAMLASNGAEAAPASLAASLGKLAISGLGQGSRAVAVPGMGWAVGMGTTVAALALFLGGALFWRGATRPPVPTDPPVAAQAPEVLPPAAEPLALAAAPGAGALAAIPANVAEAKSLRGLTRTAEGFARGGVNVCPNWPVGAFSTDRSDGNGQFTTAWTDDAPGDWMAYSGTTLQAGLFHVDAEGWRTPLDIRLDFRMMEVSGRTVTPDGHLVPKTMVQLRVTDGAGDVYLASPFNADAQGYFDTGYVPAKDGCTLAARIVPPGDREPGPWSREYPLFDTIHHQELDDLIASPQDAEWIAADQGFESFNSCHLASLANAVPRVRLGGTVVDEAGNPVANACIELMYPAASGMLASSVAGSDASGHWSRLVPERPRRIDARIVHPEFVPTVVAGNDRIPSLESMLSGTSEIVLHRGTKVTGTVVDPEGKPVPDVLLLTHRMYSRIAGGPEANANDPIEDASTTRTDATGRFTLSCLAGGESTLQLSAPAFAPTLAKIDANAVPAPVTITMDPGSVIRGRIVDEGGAPLPGAYVYGSSWQAGGQEYPLSIQDHADANGDFVLARVPSAGETDLSFGVRNSDGRRDRRFLNMSANKLAPREEPYAIVMYQPIEFNGEVVDDSTGEPVTAFTVTNGWELSGRFDAIRYSDPTEVHHERGVFSKKLDGVSISYPPADVYAVKIVADGYLPAVSPTVSFGENVEPFTIRLKRGAPWNGIVVDTRGLPVAGAAVAWVDEGHLAFIQRGQLDDRVGNAPAYVETTGGDGAFMFPAAESAALVLALHESGYAVSETGQFRRGSALVLQPWAAVSGTLIAAESPGEAPYIVLRAPESSGEEKPRIQWNFGTNPDPDGHFQFTNVPSVELLIGQRVVNQRRVDLAMSQLLHPAPGEALELTLGGGCRVEGQVTYIGDSSDLPQIIRVIAQADDGSPEQAAFTWGNSEFAFPSLAPGVYTITASFYDEAIQWPGGLGSVLAADTRELAIAADGPEVVAAPQLVLTLAE